MRVRAKWWVRGAPMLVTVIRLEGTYATVLVDGYTNSDIAALGDVDFEPLSLSEVANPCVRSTCKITGAACPQRDL